MHCCNFADEIQTLCSMVADSDFDVSLSSSRVPTIILYINRQIEDIKAYCFNSNIGSVLSVDKTYNLGQLYVSVTVYRNLALQRSSTGDDPIFNGPMFVHGNSDFEMYAALMGHLSAQLVKCDFSTLRVGSDEELAVHKAIAHCFPAAQLVACTRHLKENLRRTANKYCTGKDMHVNKLVSEVFGPSGLTIVYDDMLRRITLSALPDLPLTFKAYFDTKLELMLRGNMIAGCAGWTNNACESINHVLKQQMQWRRSMLPDLCKKLQSLVTSQYLEADRALCGRGDLQLQPAYQCHRITVNEWHGKSDKDLQHLRDTVFSLPVQKTAGAQPVESTDGELRVLHQPNVGKKLNQCK